MYVKNNTNYNQQFKAGGRGFTMRPGDTTSITEDEYGDHAVQFLVARGVLSVLKEDEGLSNVVAQADEKKAKAEERKLEVNKAGEDTTKQVMMAQCSAFKKNGERCGNNVAVKMSEYSEDMPYFCGTHKREKAEDYEKVEGVWRKKVPVENDMELESAENQVTDDVISDDEIAEALAEALVEEE